MGDKVFRRSKTMQALFLEQIGNCPFEGRNLGWSKIIKPYLQLNGSDSFDILLLCFYTKLPIDVPNVEGFSKPRSLSFYVFLFKIKLQNFANFQYYNAEAQIFKNN